MHKSLLLAAYFAAVLLFVHSASAQWSFNGVKIFYTAGNVGVGINNPAFTLDVRSVGTRAIYGTTTAANGTADALYGLSRSTEGRGVIGYCDASTGFNYGVYGRADSTQGRGVFGYAAANSGVNMGVYGKTNSPNGYAGYFAGNVGVTGWIGTKANAPVVLQSNNVPVMSLQSVTNGIQISANVTTGWNQNSIGVGVIGATISGGGMINGANPLPNFISSNYSTIGGGFDNRVTGSGGTIAGGSGHRVSNFSGSVGGGLRNEASGGYSTVAGGIDNTASGAYTQSTVGGGQDNTASGDHSTVPGGFSNLASGDGSFAAGTRAKADNDGSFVWADGTSADFFATANNQFRARASGGVQFVNSAGMGVGLAAGGNSWSALSDRNVKCNIKAIDPRVILEKLAGVPITRWNLISQVDSIHHIGPMAQDFHAAFGVGEDERCITQTDADGVALAAIQGLNQIVKEKEDQIAALRAEINAEKERSSQQQESISDLGARLSRLEAQINNTTQAEDHP